MNSLCTVCIVAVCSCLIAAAISFARSKDEMQKVDPDLVRASARLDAVVNDQIRERDKEDHRNEVKLLILFMCREDRKRLMDFEDKINSTLFPGEPKPDFARDLFNMTREELLNAPQR